jgi:hypothetical protein
MGGSGGDEGCPLDAGASMGAAMSDAGRSPLEAAILQANATFYRMFSRGDVQGMSDLWAGRAPVACYHPASPVLIGRGPVLDSWRQILRERPPFVLRCDRPIVHLLGNAAIVTCYEGNGRHPAHLAATNVFVLEDNRWRMVLHQAGPLSVPVPMPPAEPSAVN